MDLALESGRVHALMGPNGSGKSTLALALAGEPGYTVTRGRATLDGEDLLALPPHERARKGLFLAFQYPRDRGGLLREFLRLACAERGQGFCEFQRNYPQALRRLRMEGSTAGSSTWASPAGRRSGLSSSSSTSSAQRSPSWMSPTQGWTWTPSGSSPRRSGTSPRGDRGPHHHPLPPDPRARPPGGGVRPRRGRIVERGPELAHRIGEEGFEVVRP